MKGRRPQRDPLGADICASATNANLATVSASEPYDSYMYAGLRWAGLVSEISDTTLYLL